MTNQDLYYSFIRRLRKYRLMLDGLRNRKVNASSVAEQKEFILQIVAVESKIEEIRDLMELWNLYPEPVKEKQKNVQ